MSYPSVILGDSPLAYYRMDALGGNTEADQSGNGHGGVYSQGSPGGYTLGLAGATTRDSDTAVEFVSADTGVLTVDKLVGFGAGLANSSLEFWIKTTTSFTRQPVSNLNPGTTMQISVVLNRNAVGTNTVGATNFRIRGNTGNTWQGGITDNIYDGSWHQVVLTVSGTTASATMAVYVDGIASSSFSTASGNPFNYGSFVDFANNFTIGAENNKGVIGAYIDGQIDEVAFYSTALTPTQILLHYNAAQGFLIQVADHVTHSESIAGYEVSRISVRDSSVHTEVATVKQGFSVKVSDAASHTETSRFTRTSFDIETEAVHVKDLPHVTTLTPVATGVEWTAAEDILMAVEFESTLAVAVSTTPLSTSATSGFTPSGTYTVSANTAGWPASGKFQAVGITGDISYGAVTGTTFTGCTGGVGTAAIGAAIHQVITESWTINDNLPAGAPAANWNVRVGTETATVTSWVGKVLTVRRSQNMSTPTTHLINTRVYTSISDQAGMFGMDVHVSIDLGGGRVLWMWGDPGWAHASGATKPPVPFPRSVVAIQSGYDITTGTLTFYHGTGGTLADPVDFFPAVAQDGCPNVQWAGWGTMLDDRLLIIINRGTGAPGPEQPNGHAAIIVQNPSDTPDNWVWKYVTLWTETSPTPAGGQVSPQFGWCGVWDDAPISNWLYIFGTDGHPKLYVSRVDRDQAKLGNLGQLQWWCGGRMGWNVLDPARPNRFQRATIAPSNTFLLRFATVTRMPDNRWRLIGIDGGGIGNVGYAIGTSGDPGQIFPAMTEVFVPPDVGQGLNYIGMAHPELTWSGKTPFDVLVTWTPGFPRPQEPKAYWTAIAKTTNYA